MRAIIKNLKPGYGQFVKSNNSIPVLAEPKHGIAAAGTVFFKAIGYSYFIGL